MNKLNLNLYVRMTLCMLLIVPMLNNRGFANTLYFGDSNGMLNSYDTSSGNPNFFALSSLQNVLAVASDGSLLGTDSGSASLLKVNAGNGGIVSSYTPGGPITGFTQSLDNIYVGANTDVYGLTASSFGLSWKNTLSGSTTALSSSASGQVYAGSSDGKVTNLNGSNGSQNYFYNTATTSAITAIDIGKNNQVFFGNQNGDLYSIDSVTGAKNYSFSAGVAISQVVSSSNSVFFLNGGSIDSLNASTGALQFTFYSGRSALTHLTFGSGNSIFTAGVDGNIYELDSSTGSLIHSLATGAAVKQLTFGSDGNLYALSGNTIDEINTSTLTVISTFNSGASVSSFAVAPVPEPETYAMLMAGLGLIGAAMKRRKAKQA